ncbi:MAG TPA: type II secretion system major pseudopilin GspG [Steroidobacteraceae bacterium]|nr:type II secretion system major pseudopilin GspG [Steroidobacteraceae bacterium]
MAGFTLLEIMVVVVIIGILGALIAPQIFGQVEKARVTKAKQDIKSLESALEMYRLDNFRYPTELKALVEKPVEAKNWKTGGYLQRLEKDPWDSDYQYAFPGQHGKVYDLYTFGADGQEGGEEYDADITNWAPN